jgi:hypothetical protein
MRVNADFRDLFAALNDAGAEYLVVGGYAFSFHAFPRFTKDLDIWIRATPDNAARVHAALTVFGAPLDDVAESDLASEGLIFQIGVVPNRIDILTSVSGVEFDEAWQDREETRYGDQTICLISRAHLIQNKRAVGRPQDLVDADQLERELDRGT